MADRHTAPKPPLAPPPRIGPATHEVERQRPRRWVTAAALAAAAAALLVVFVILPRWVEEHGADAATVPSRAPLPEATVVPASTAPAALACEVSDRLAALESRHVVVWGGPAWTRVRELVVTTGTDTRAAVAWEEAADLLDELEAAAGSAHDRAVAHGRTALARGDAEAARRAFALAARIEPTSPEAAAGLRRAEVHDQVFGLVEAAHERERAGDAPGAVEAARRALALDPSSAQARELVARCQQRIADGAYAETMSQGLAALDAGRFNHARKLFTRAVEMRPGARESADGLARAEAGLARTAVAEHRQRGAELEAQEQWRAAAEAYAGALALDPSLVFARAGRQRCLDRARLATELDAHLAHPHRLVAEEVLDAAVELLDEARAVAPQGPAHRDRVERLAEAVRLASTPVPVVLTSDGVTEVVIYRLGRLGVLTRRVVELRPGRWVVVGSRSGYRDVRHELEVVVGGAPALDVRCTEAVRR